MLPERLWKAVLPLNDQKFAFRIAQLYRLRVLAGHGTVGYLPVMPPSKVTKN